MQAKLITTFSPLGEPAFLARVGGIVNALRGNPHFPEPWLAQVGTFADLEADYNAYQSALNAAANGDRAKIGERRAARDKLTDRLATLAAYLELVAEGDTAKLLTTGYELRKDNNRGTRTGAAPAPDSFSAKHGPLSGQVLLHAARVEGARSYEYQLTEGNPNDESAWKSGDIQTSCNRIEINGLSPGKTYWFRLRAIDTHGNGAWTDPVSLIVV